MTRVGWRRAEVLGVALVLLPLVVSAVVLVVRVGGSYHPYSDWALTEMRTRDVGTQPVLIGLYSRDGWSHPGPMSFYLLAIPYRLSGEASIGLWLGALFLNAMAIIGMAIVARRRAGTAFMLCTLLGVALVMRTLGADYLRNPWNLTITVLPYGLLLYLTWAMLCGRAWTLPVAAAVATFLAQAHVQYVALAAPLVAVGALSLAVQSIRYRHRTPPEGLVDDIPTIRSVARAGGVTAAVLAVLWTPTIVQEIGDKHGNLTRIVDFFQHPGQPTHTLADGFHIVTAQFGIAPEWLTTKRAPTLILGETRFLSHAPLQWLLVLFGAAIYVAVRRRDRDALRFAAVLLLAIVVGIIAVASVSGTMYDYRLQWTWLIGMSAMVLIAWTIWKEIERRFARSGRYLVMVAVFGIATVSAASVVGAIRAADPQAPLSAILGRVTTAAERSLPPGKGDVIVDTGDPFLTPGLLLALDRDGVRARAPAPDSAHLWGDGTNRIHSGGPVRATVFVAVDGDVDRHLKEPDVKLLSYWGTVSIGERERIATEIERQQTTLNAEVAAGKLTSEQYLAARDRAAHLMPTEPGTAVTAIAVFMRH